MLEAEQLITTFDELVAAGSCGALATITHVEGSTYRLPGTRMLLTDSGDMTGLVSGGCLESDLLEHAKPVIESGESRTVHYDYTDEDDIVWGLGLGCAGVVDVLLERINRKHPGPMELIRNCMQARQPGFLATDISTDGHLAARWLQFPDGTTTSYGWTTAMPDFGILSKHRTAHTGHEQGHILLERIDPRLRLVVFGAGPDVSPLARLADSLGWQVEVYDHRPANIRPDQFPPAVVPQLCRPEEATQIVRPDERTAILLMTHHYPSDQVLLQSYVDSDAGYVGALGPKRRTEMMLSEIDCDNTVPAGKLYAPIGLDIGGEAPADIALAIVAEIQSVFSNREGGFLRNRGEPIHERRD